MEDKDLAKFKKELRNALADYIASAGCGCCADREELLKVEDRLGRLLNVHKYTDGSGYNFYVYRTKTK